MRQFSIHDSFATFAEEYWVPQLEFLRVTPVRLLSKKNS